ncbi:MAG: DUF3108 domain-containing protein [Pseudomonadota bacterium]|nr:MAG: DUF3108 domain-containing protein [Pseudomonadota bacterium]
MWRWQGCAVGAALLLVTQAAAGNDYPQWHLTEARVPNAENLLYTLSYSGILSAYVWAELADVAVSAPAAQRPFAGQPSCELSLRLSTEDHGFAELLRPVRYHWRSRVSPDLLRAYLAEEIDDGKRQRHRTVWLDWENGKVELYRKRQLVAVPQYAPDDEENLGNQQFSWEHDGDKALPAFLDTRPRIDAQLSSLVFDKAVQLPTDEPIIEPLASLFAVRWHDFDASGELPMTVSYRDEINANRARLIGRETIALAQSTAATLRVAIMRSNEEEAGKEGTLTLWLSDDPRRLPLQIEIDAGFGKLRLQIAEASHQEQPPPARCVAPAPSR